MIVTIVVPCVVVLVEDRRHKRGLYHGFMVRTGILASQMSSSGEQMHCSIGRSQYPGLPDRPNGIDISAPEYY